MAKRLLHHLHDAESNVGMLMGGLFIFTLAGDLVQLVWKEEVLTSHGSLGTVLHYSHGITALYAIMFILNVVFASRSSRSPAEAARVTRVSSR